MAIGLHHSWNLSPAEARALQRELAPRVERADRLGAIEYLAGVDVGFEADGRVTRAAVAVLRARDLSLADSAIARLPTAFPYVPGLLSFREAPAVLEALANLRVQPDLLLCDGQGIAHPRRLGIAAHLGLLTGLPAIGVAKSRLLGEHGPVPEAKGQWTPLLDKGEPIGAVLRTRLRVAPLYVSIGHRIGLETAIHWVMACITRYRLPETTRQAHRLASGPAPGGA